MNVHFEKEKAPLRELIELCDVALALIRERRQLLKLLRADAVGKEGHDIFNATFKRLKNLERVSHQIRLAFRNPVGVEDDRGRLKAFGKRSAGVLHGPSAVRQQPAGAIMHGDSESAAHNARGENPAPKARAVSGVMTIARSPPSSQLGQAALR